ncbi:MAG: hypothetical protein ACTHNS_02895 [Marmoricola sp.]
MSAPVLIVLGLFETNIETSKPDAAITAWLASHGNGTWLAHASATALGAVLLIVRSGAARPARPGVTSIVLAVVVLASAFLAPLMAFVLWLLLTGAALGSRRRVARTAPLLAGA